MYFLGGRDRFDLIFNIYCRLFTTLIIIPQIFNGKYEAKLLNCVVLR